MSLMGAGVVGAAYAGGTPMAANSMDMQTSELREVLTPSVLESAAFGFMVAGHKTGLQSGGLLGYSTFFSGYDPSQGHGMGRQLSLGRAAGGAVSAAGKALGKIPGLAGSKYIESMKSFHRYGMWSFNYQDGKGFDTATGQPLGGRQGTTAGHFKPVDNRGPRGRSHLAGRFGYDNAVIMDDSHARARAMEEFKNDNRPYRKRHSDGLKGSWKVAQSQRKTSVAGAPFRESAKMKEMKRNLAGGRIKGSMSRGGPKGQGRILSHIASWFGGTGASKDGSEFRLTTGTLGDGTKINIPGRGAGKGLNIMKGAGGKLVGRGFQFAAAYEVASFAARGIGHAVGAGYESMVESTERLRRKTGADQMMSGGYFNRAATSERQRAVQTMNTSTLHPRYQMMGNEAYWMHN